jgi:chemotaxis protein MotB
MLSYIDVLTLLLTLMVVLLVLQRQKQDVTEVTAVVAMPVIERALPTQVEPIPAPVEESPEKAPEPETHLVAGEGGFNSGSRGVDAQALVDVLNWNGLTQGVTVVVEDDQLRLETEDDILFSPASANLTTQGMVLLHDLSEVLRLHPGRLSVEGHADNIPINNEDYPSNWELSAARAARVVRFLVDMGVGAGRLRAIGYSDTRPRADNSTEQGRASNRRVSLVLDLRPDQSTEDKEGEMALYGG